jgi:hypothetical protein
MVGLSYMTGSEAMKPGVCGGFGKIQDWGHHESSAPSISQKNIVPGLLQKNPNLPISRLDSPTPHP